MKRKHLKSAALTVTAALMLTGCGLNPANNGKTTYFDTAYQSSGDLSFANNVMHAAGITRIEDAKSSLHKPNVPQGGVSAVGMTADAAIEAMADPVSLGLNSAGLMNAMFWLTRPRAPERDSVMFTWAPSSEVQNPYNYKKFLVQKAADSLNKYFSQKKYKDLTASPYEFSKPVASISLLIANGVSFVGPNCSEPKEFDLECFIGIGTTKENLGEYDHRYFRGVIKAQAPDFVSEPSDWFIKTSLRKHLFTMTGKLRAEIDTLSAYQAVSADMPKEVYFYLAPNTYTYLHPEKGVAVGKAPILLNQGNTHFFVAYKE